MPSGRDLHVASVCRLMPTPVHPTAGQFVARRLAGMRHHAKVRAIQPVPYLPGVRPLPPWAREAGHDVNGMTVDHAPMLYVPGVLKCLDGRWLARATRSTLGRLQARGRLDVVDAHFAYPDGVGSVLVARQLGVPVFVTVRGVEVDQLRRPCLRRQIVAALRAATGVISVSHTLRDVLVTAGVDGDRVRVIHNAVDRSAYRPGNRVAARQRLGLPLGDRLVVSVGNLVELKRHHLLVEAVARADVPNLRLAILGGGDPESGYTARVNDAAAARGIAERVQIVGRVPPERVIDWLQAADVFALATSREGCCNAVLEALACGVPVVTTPAGDNAHFVRDGVNGRITPIDDVEALAGALRDVVRRDNWDPEVIAATLQVGDWNAVGRQVVEFFTERVAV